MININSILAGLTPVTGLSKALKPLAEQSSQSVSEVKDSFRVGEEWRNRGQLNDSKKDGGNSQLAQVERAYEGQPYLAVSGQSPKVVTSPEDNNDEDTQPVGADEPSKGEVNSGAPGNGTEDGEQAEGMTVGPVAPDGTPLSASEKQYLAQLQEADVKVKAHEMAHLAAAGGYATGGASFQYQQGPDGKKYAVGGEVPIDIGKEASPGETIAKMKIVRQAALAPADPSPQDQSVASRATLNIAEATQELRVNEATSQEIPLDGVAKGSGSDGFDDLVSQSENGAKSINVGLTENTGQSRPSFSAKAYSSSNSVVDNLHGRSALNLFA